MVAPTNLAEYFEKFLPVRDQLKTYKNTLSEEGVDLKDVTKDQLVSFGLSEAKADLEIAKLDAAKGVFASLTVFDNACN